MLYNKVPCAAWVIKQVLAHGQTTPLLMHDLGGKRHERPQRNLPPPPPNPQELLASSRNLVLPNCQAKPQTLDLKPLTPYLR